MKSIAINRFKQPLRESEFNRLESFFIFDCICITLHCNTYLQKKGALCAYMDRVDWYKWDYWDTMQIFIHMQLEWSVLGITGLETWIWRACVIYWWLWLWSYCTYWQILLAVACCKYYDDNGGKLVVPISIWQVIRRDMGGRFARWYRMQ